MWSAQQQSMLNAMGYTLYVRPSAVIRIAKAEVAVATALLPPMPSGESPTSSSALFKAVMKAAHGKDISRLGIDIDAIRNSPQAKRALWPQLRKLMKS